MVFPLRFTQEDVMSRETISFVVGLVCAILWALVWTICLLGWRVARIRYGGKVIPSRLDSLSPESVPGVTIIRPLCGLDNNMFSTLESVMRLDYPNFEVIFAVQDENDEALSVVGMVIEKYPLVSSRIVINSAKVGVNPKVNNLIEPFAQARHDLLWVIDATISVAPGVLGRMVDAFLCQSTFDLESAPLMSDDYRKPPTAGDVGLVHQVPIAVVYQRTWGSLIEQAYLNTTHAKMYLSINALSVDSCVVGKSNLYSRANISSLKTPSPSLRELPEPPTGLAGFGPFMAEDNMIGLSLWHDLGLKHAMTSDVALDFIGALTVRGYIDRRARWIRVRKMMTLSATIIEPLTESIMSGLYGSWAISRLLGAHQPAIFLLHMLLWLCVDLSVRSALTSNVGDFGPPSSTAQFIPAWVARELLAFPIWLYAMSGSSVTWRGKRYQILASGEAKRI